MSLKMDCISCYISVLTILLYIIPESLSIRCYVCSYSPEDKNNRTDKCTEENFQPQNVFIHECPLGCEAFVQYDSNDMLEQWRRNCVREGQPITGECKVNKILGWKQVRCTCERDLCNAATTFTPSIVPLMLSSCLLLSILRCFFAT